MNKFSSLLKSKPADTPEPSSNGDASATPSSKFSLPSFKGFPDISLPAGPSLPGFGFFPTGIDSIKNVNAELAKCLHPSVEGSEDPHYTVDHDILRGAMHFPATWKDKMKRQPVILVPPTGLYGGTAYKHNFAKLLDNWDYVNYMWLNIPGAMADYSAKNAEHVAYAIHYVAETTGQQVALIAWSQGNLSCQWTLKYWPLARSHVNNFISVSADFHGTFTAYASVLPTTPSILNQRYYSNFIRTLRSNGGDSSYVPHTTIYSSFFDEIVQPQAGEGASAYMKDERKVGVLNVDVQQVAAGTPAGYLYGHGTLIFNSLTWALAKDAIQNGGPARLDRIDMRTVCKDLWAPGLSLYDCVTSVRDMATFVGNCLLFRGKLFTEGELPAYALAESQALGPPEEITPEQQAIIDKSKEQASKTGLPAAVDPKAIANAVMHQLKTGQPGTLAAPAS